MAALLDSFYPKYLGTRLLPGQAGSFSGVMCGLRIEDINLCLAEAERIAQRGECKYPRLAAQIPEQFEQTLSVHGLEKASRRCVYTTHMLERVMREIKRRIRVIRIFPHGASCDRLVRVHLIEIHET